MFTCELKSFWNLSVGQQDYISHRKSAATKSHHWVSSENADKIPAKFFAITAYFRYCGIINVRKPVAQVTGPRVFVFSEGLDAESTTILRLPAAVGYRRCKIRVPCPVCSETKAVGPTRFSLGMNVVFAFFVYCHEIWFCNYFLLFLFPLIPFFFFFGGGGVVCIIIIILFCCAILFKR